MLLPEFNHERCDLCGSRSVSDIGLRINKRTLTSDSRIVDEPLHKVQCKKCRLVRRGNEFKTQSLLQHYEKEYQLALESQRIEPKIFTTEGVRNRSEIVFQWFYQALDSAGIYEPKTIMEIGCGEGNLLDKFQRYYPDAKVQGIDMSEFAGIWATKYNRDIISGSYLDINGKFDVIYSFAVIEHVPSPLHYLNFLKQHLTDEGVIVVSQPCQDYDSKDIFFNDHLFHFAGRHIEQYSKAVGMQLKYFDNSFCYFPDFSMAVLSNHAISQNHCSDYLTKFDEDFFASNLEKRLEKLSSLNLWLSSLGGDKIGVWGIGQTFKYYLAYSDLEGSKINAGIDSNITQDEVYNEELELHVCKPELLHCKLDGVKDILFTFNPSEKHLQEIKSLDLNYFVVT